MIYTHVIPPKRKEVQSPLDFIFHLSSLIFFLLSLVFSTAPPRQLQTEHMAARKMPAIRG
jgi:hypothetical protein